MILTSITRLRVTKVWFLNIHLHIWYVSAGFSWQKWRRYQQLNSIWISIANVGNNDWRRRLLPGGPLTPLPLDKMVAVSQTTFSNAFSRINIFVFRFTFHWSLFTSVQLTLSEHWIRQRLVAEPETRHYLNQCRPISPMYICGTRGRWLIKSLLKSGHGRVITSTTSYIFLWMQLLVHTFIHFIFISS